MLLTIRDEPATGSVTNELTVADRAVIVGPSAPQAEALNCDGRRHLR